MQNRRSEEEMMSIILDVANKDERIRGVVLNGSRANPDAKKDIFQDYDIVYVVNDIESLANDDKWLKQYGDVLIMQKPDEMDGNWPKSKTRFAYLMQFTDGNRLDLTLIPQNKFRESPKDSHSILLLDKDNLIETIAEPNEKSYLPQPPTQKEFFNCCNEFFWCSLSVAKGIARKELTYAKYMSEQVVKDELIKLLTWYAGIKTNFQKPIGKYGRYLEKYLEPEVWKDLRNTYVDADYDHMWLSLFEMCSLFNKIALFVAKHFNYLYSDQQYQDITDYFKMMQRFR